MKWEWGRSAAGDEEGFINVRSFGHILGELAGNSNSWLIVQKLVEEESRNQTLVERRVRIILSWFQHHLRSVLLRHSRWNDPTQIVNRFFIPLEFEKSRLNATLD